MTAISLNANKFAAVAHAVSTEETRYYLNGVFIEYCGDMLHMTATCGHMLLSARTPLHGAAPFDAFILAVKGATKNDMVKACRAKGADRLILEADGLWRVVTDSGRELRMGRWEKVDGAFPDYRRVFRCMTSNATRVVVPIVAERMARVHDACKALGKKTYRTYASDLWGPHIIDFLDENVTGLIMPAVKPKDYDAPEALSVPSWVDDAVRT